VIFTSPSQHEIPVVPLPVPEPKVEPLIKHAFGEISVRFVKQHLHDQALVVSQPTSPHEGRLGGWDAG
jgi:hypothetical protein